MSTDLAMPPSLGEPVSPGSPLPADAWTRLDRWLTLGSVTSTYHARSRDLAPAAAAQIGACFHLDANRTVAEIVGRAKADGAPSRDPAIFALALGAADADVDIRRIALSALPAVCPEAIDLFQFVTAVRGLGRGWGRTLKRAVAEWYERLSADDLALQAIRHRSRLGYSHKRLLQTAHPRAGGPAKEALFRWLTSGDLCEELPAIIRAHLQAMQPGADRNAVRSLVAAHDLPWTALPRTARTWPEVWEAKLPLMDAASIIRSLGHLTAMGMLGRQAVQARIITRLTDPNELRAARLHPTSLLAAHAAYASGGSTDRLWAPEPAVLGALLRAFHLTLAGLPQQRCRSLIAVDVSESMTTEVAGMTLSAFDVAVATTMEALHSHQECRVLGFSSGLRGVRIKRGDDLEIARKRLSELPFGPTDCALPIREAMRKEWRVDAFVVLTDDETWHRDSHPAEALRAYRRASGIEAKLVVIGLTSRGFTIADSADRGMLDIVGFDLAAPAVLAGFLAS